MELFHFDGLAAGVYSLLVFDGEERILFNERVALATGEAARVDLRMEFIDVEFAITGPAGEPFVGVWEEDGQEYEGPVEFYFRSDGVACASARTAARSAFGFTKNPDGTVTRMPVTDRVLLRDPEVIAREKAARDVVAAALANSARDMQLAVGNEEMLQMLRSLDAPTPALEVSEPPPVRVPDDHPREEGEEPGFAPWSESPQVETRPLRAKRVAPGLYRVEKVPMQADGVLVTSGPYFVSTAIDLRRRGGVPVEIAFTSRCNATSELFVGARSCFDCHGEQGVATMGW